MSLVQTILAKKGPHVYSIAEERSVFEAARAMTEHRVGALVVTRGDLVVGIFTERDLMNRVVAAERDPRETLIRDVMTSPVACCTPETTREECRTVMRAQRLRHLPVVQDGSLVGIVSIGDVLQAAEDDHVATIQYLYEYMHGEWS